MTELLVSLKSVDPSISSDSSVSSSSILINSFSVVHGFLYLVDCLLEIGRNLRQKTFKMWVGGLEVSQSLLKSWEKDISLHGLDVFRREVELESKINHLWLKGFNNTLSDLFKLRISPNVIGKIDVSGARIDTATFSIFTVTIAVTLTLTSIRSGRSYCIDSLVNQSSDIGLIDQKAQSWLIKHWLFCGGLSSSQVSGLKSGVKLVEIQRERSHGQG